MRHSRSLWPLVGLTLFCFAACTPAKSPPFSGSRVHAPKKATWPLNEPYPVSKDDLAFGEVQVAKMVADRPSMGRSVDENSPVWAWCVRRFAGSGTGHRISWDPAPVESQGYDAEHDGPTGEHGAAIRVSKHVRDSYDSRQRWLTGHQLWAAAVFELNNSCHDPEFDAVWDEALDGKLDKKTFVELNTRLEFAAEEETYLFFQHVWMPWATAKGIENRSETDWGQDSASGYDVWMAGYTDPDSYPWDSWGKWSDEIIVPYVKSWH